MFAVGDIHGCAAELQLLLKYFGEQLSLTEDDVVIFIGDYIDRGPDSKGVVDQLIEFQQNFPQTIFLRGNHEDMMLDYLGFDGRMGASYLLNGGDKFVQSYDLPGEASPQDILKALPTQHISFFLNLERYVTVGDYVFAHAGLNPLRDLEQQLDDDLFWIRDEFIANIHQFDKTVVFGHTPYQDIMFHLPYKIGIDTGCVYGNMLTCIEVLSGTIYQIDAQGDEVRTDTFENRGIDQSVALADS